MKSLSSNTTPTFELLSGTSPEVIPGVSGVVVSTTHYDIQSLSGAPLSAFDTRFWYRGLLTFNDKTLAALSGKPSVLTLSAKCLYEDTATSPTLKYTVTGFAPFTCYPKNYYEVYKQNENFDFEQTIKLVQESPSLLGATSEAPSAPHLKWRCLLTVTGTPMHSGICPNV